MPPSDAKLAELLDAAIAERPRVDTGRLVAALAALCQARDETTDATKRERINLLVTMVMAVKHPLGPPPWEALVDARAAAFRPVGLDP